MSKWTLVRERRLSNIYDYLRKTTNRIVNVGYNEGLSVCIYVYVCMYAILFMHLFTYRDEALAKVQEALGEEIYKAEKERTEMERVREELHLEEQEEAARQKEKEEVEKRIRERLEQQAVYAQQMHLKAQRVAAEREEEENFKQMVCYRVFYCYL